MSETKRCPRCERNLPRTPEHFRPRARGVGQFLAWCRECERVHRKTPRAPGKYIPAVPGHPMVTGDVTNLAKAIERIWEEVDDRMATEQGEKICKSCNRTLPLSEFHSNGEFRYRSRCKRCINAGRRNRYATDPDYRGAAITRRHRQ